jgi:hypothetical protein
MLAFLIQMPRGEPNVQLDESVCGLVTLKSVAVTGLSGEVATVGTGVRHPWDHR